MTEIFFYHLGCSTLDKVLPILLQKTMIKGKRALVVVDCEANVEQLSHHLWTYKTDSWLPHGTITGNCAGSQPILIGKEDNNLNRAEFIFLTQGSTSNNIASFERCFEIINGNDKEAIMVAHEKWESYKAEGHTLSYWKETDSGSWVDGDIR